MREDTEAGKEKWRTKLGVVSPSPREAVLRFAGAMEDELQKHDSEYGPEGWIGANPLWLLKWLRDEVGELDLALMDEDVEDADVLAQNVMKKAAAVGNLAMMIHDVVLRFRSADPALRFRQVEKRVDSVDNL